MKKKFSWDNFAPEGVNAKKEAVWTLLALGASAVWSLTFLSRLGRERSEKEPLAAAGKVVGLLGFRELLGTALVGFYLVALGMACLAMWHYAKLRRTKIKDPKDAHGRALAIPVIGIALAFGVSSVIFLIYQGVYMDYRAHIEEVFNKALGL